eukprot:COSAG02_NODE_716_length_18084_cov_101.241145_13_plen_65_part_00
MYKLHHHEAFQIPPASATVLRYCTVQLYYRTSTVFQSRYGVPGTRKQLDLGSSYRTVFQKMKKT